MYCLAPWAAGRLVGDSRGKITTEAFSVNKVGLSHQRLSRLISPEALAGDKEDTSVSQGIL